MNNLKKNQIVSFDYDNKARLGRVDCVHTVHPIWLDGPMVKGITVEVNDCEDGEQKFKGFPATKFTISSSFNRCNLIGTGSSCRIFT